MSSKPLTRVYAVRDGKQDRCRPLYVRAVRARRGARHGRHGRRPQGQCSSRLARPTRPPTCYSKPTAPGSSCSLPPGRSGHATRHAREPRGSLTALASPSKQQAEILRMTAACANSVAGTPQLRRWRLRPRSQARRLSGNGPVAGESLVGPGLSESGQSVPAPAR